MSEKENIKEESSENKKEEIKFKNLVEEKNLIEIKGFLSKMKIILEQKLEDKLDELIELKQELPHLIHLKRISKLEQEKNNES